MKQRALTAFLATMAFFTTGMPGVLHAENPQKTSTVAQVGSEMRQSYDEIAALSREQRDEVVNSARQELHDLDANIDQLQNDLDQQWDTMSETTRRESRQALADLRRQRNEVAQWLGGLRYSSKETWDEVKQGFSDSLGKLKSAFGEMRDHFSSSE